VRTLDDQGEALANARLIAEAPEMHSLLMRFKDFQYAVILRLQQARVGEEANALKSLYHELDAVLERIAGSN